MVKERKRVGACCLVVGLVFVAGCGGDDKVRTVVKTVAPPDTSVTVPGVEGKPGGRARKTLSRAGLVAKVRRKQSDRSPGRVIRQSPSAGVRVEGGSTIKLTVAKKREPPPVTSCGNLVESGAGSYNVQATGIDCATARQVAAQWEKECAQTPSGSCEVSSGYYCSFQAAGEELGYINCVDGERQVKFETGA